MRRGIGVIVAGVAGMAFTAVFAAEAPVKAAWGNSSFFPLTHFIRSDILPTMYHSVVLW
jgi:hypothetical protein